jgi:hypothetical protein
MIFHKKIAAVAVFAALVTDVLVWHGANAATVSENQAVGCSITQDDLAGIRAIQTDPALDYQNEVIQELAARKALLTKTIACATVEVGTLRDTLDSVSSTDPGVTSIRNQLMSKLDDVSNYYDLENGKLAEAGVTGTEQVAKEILAWRGNILAPLGNQIDGFAVWSENQLLFVAATARMAQISRVVSFLAATNNHDLAGAFAKAQASFHAAQDENSATERALTQSVAADQVSALMQHSLNTLSETYQNFFSISTIIQGVTSDAGQK